MISVCMASYNGAIFIKQQAVSILNQLGLEDELIISDDGSKDNTLEILASLNDSRIKIYHHSAPHGVVSNFENAIKHASGDYIFLSDQDDICVPIYGMLSLYHPGLPSYLPQGLDNNLYKP